MFGNRRENDLRRENAHLLALQHGAVRGAKLLEFGILEKLADSGNFSPEIDKNLTA